MAPASVAGSHSSAFVRRPSVPWRPTKIMNMRDLSKDDDFLSHLLVEKLGTGAVPLYVHKMDPSRRLPKVDARDLMAIVRRLVANKLGPQIAVRQAVDDLLALPPVLFYLKPYTQKQINAFATHASRYFELYHPNGTIEIAHTSRYSHMTGKSELCILATRPLTPGMVIAELKGSMAHLSTEEDRELKRTDLRNSDIRRDFSVIHSRQMKKNHLFLGPARFVNHDCENNCELFREGKYITFRVIRPISVGEEITAHYGDGYFGRKNRFCLCETCEKNGRGGYAPENPSGSGDPDAGASEDDFSDSEPTATAVGNVNERRTRRGVYAIVQEQDDDSSESEDEEKETEKPLADAPDVGVVDLESGGHLSSRRPSASRRSVSSTAPRSRSSCVPEGAKEGSKSVISTRRQRQSTSAMTTPSLSTKSLTPMPNDCTQHSSSGSRASASRLSTPVNKGKEKERVPIKEEPEARVLRMRPSLHTEKGESLSVIKRTVPLGPDGRPLPICVTCSNVLPVISVNNKVVWGLNLDTSPRRGRKRKDQECPRCMRHLAIYNHSWPARLPSQVVGPSGRDDPEPSRRPAQKTSSATERKRPPGAAERSPKKNKTDQALVVEMSSKAKEMLMPPKRKRGRPRKYPLPQEEPPKRKRGRPRIHSPSRSRPSSARKPVAPKPCPPASLRSSSTPSTCSYLGPKSLAVQSQPRDSNGRFGKKSTTNGRFMRKPVSAVRSSVARAQRVLQRSKVKKWLEDNHEQNSTTDIEDRQMATKRAAPTDVDISPRAIKRLRNSANMTDVTDRQTSTKRTTPTDVDASPRPIKRLRNDTQPVDGDDDPIPFSALGSTSFRFTGLNGSLLCRPNPTNFARRKWAPDPCGGDSVHEDEDTASSLRTLESDSNGPVTPEDRTPLPIPGPISFHKERQRITPDVSPRFSTPRTHADSIASVLVFKPSPVNFARRRWCSTTKSPLELASGTRRSQRLRPRATYPGEDDLLLTRESQIVSVLGASSALASRSVSPEKNPKTGDTHGISEPAVEDVDGFSNSAAGHRPGLHGDELLETTNSEDDRAVEGLLTETAGASGPPAVNEDALSRLRITYTTELPPVVPWKNAEATPMSHYLKKSASFHSDKFTSPSPTHLIHAGWDDSVSDILSE
ncbi:hypothetical protein V8B97DRAFT_1864270 [Scleroderma yunnanense]